MRKSYLDQIYQKRREKLYNVAEGSGPKLPKDWRLFNEAVGLPKSPLTRQPAALTSYQNDIGSCQHKEVIVNKANKVGITEVILREAVYRGTVGDCVGYQMALGAQDYTLAMNNLKRLTKIFWSSPMLRPLVDWERTNQRSLQLIPSLDTYYFVLPRNPEAGRGWDLLKWFMGDEGAHHGLLDDSEYPLSMQSRLANTDGYSRFPSTPRGQRGFWYEKCVAAKAGEINAKYFELPYHVGIGKFFTQEWIDDIRKKMSPAHFAQEFECAFIAGANSAIEPEILEKQTRDYESE